VEEVWGRRIQAAASELGQDAKQAAVRANWRTLVSALFPHLRIMYK